MWASGTETFINLWNEVTDVLFILKLLQEGFLLLFYISTCAMIANMVFRVMVVRTFRKEIDEGKLVAFLLGALVYMVEPNNGMSMMNKALKKKEVGGLVWDSAKWAYVRVEKDAIAVRANNDRIAGQAQVNTTLIMVGTQDVPEFMVQLITSFSPLVTR